MGYVQKVNVAMLAVVAMLVLASCGYHTAGKAARIPDSVHTIAIPVFTNKTPTYRIETVLTNAVVKEFNTRTKYRIVNQAVPDADATLTGTVISTELAPVTYDSQTGRASTALVTVTMAAPSTIPLAFPAVTKPSLANAGLSLASPSIVVSGRR